jgi:hypothetical protein
MLPLSNDNSRVQSWKPIDAAADCIGANTMSEIKWDDQVQVQMLEPTGIENYQVVEEDVIKWDGIDFAEAHDVVASGTSESKHFGTERRLRQEGCRGVISSSAIVHEPRAFECVRNLVQRLRPAFCMSLMIGTAIALVEATAILRVSALLGPPSLTPCAFAASM